MSHLAIALTSALDQLGINQSAFGESAGLTRVQVNRASRNGVGGPEVITKLVKALQAPHNARVLKAWLEDSTPAELASLVEVIPVGGSLAETPPERPRPQLDARRDRILRWVEAQLPGTEFCDMLEAFRTALDAR
jgi:hypothetical protein